MLLYYIKYFIYTAYKWNIKLAWFTIINDIKGEKKYNIKTSQNSDLKKLTIKSDNIQHADIYMGANYFLLENCFKEIKKYNRKSIVDFGSGKGRVLIVAAHYGFTKLTGVEFAEELCDIAKENIGRNKSSFPEATFRILNIDAADYVVDDDDDVFFFYSPFNQHVMAKVGKNIVASVKKAPRKIYIIYIFPQLKKMFLKAGFTEIYYYKKMATEEVSILTNNFDQPSPNENLNILHAVSENSKDTGQL